MPKTDMDCGVRALPFLMGLIHSKDKSLLSVRGSAPRTMRINRHNNVSNYRVSARTQSAGAEWILHPFDLFRTNDGIITFLLHGSLMG